MPDFSPRLPARPSLEQLRKQAVDLLRSYHDGDAAACERLGSLRPALSSAQFVVARGYGFPSWAKLKHFVEAIELGRTGQYESLAADLVEAFRGDSDALGRLNLTYGNSFIERSTPYSVETLRAKVDERLIALSRGQYQSASELALPDAQAFIASQHGFPAWAKLIASATPPYRIHLKTGTIEAGPVLSSKDWDAVFAVMKERKITGLNAGGRMTDAALKRLTKLDHVTSINLEGSLQLTDAGIAHLARMPQLRELDLSGWKGTITDTGLAVLRQLRELRRFQMCWQQNVSDAGFENLASCMHLESVNLLGTQAGDGTLKALEGKPDLRKLSTGKNVTDAGLAHLHRFPRFKAWDAHDAGPTHSLMSAQAGPTHLVIDGPFTDEGLASLGGLDGLFGLSFFWHSPAFTSAGLAPLAELPRLGFLGCQDDHCDDEAMRHIAAMPGLKMLMGQGAIAGDAGFAALSRSKTIEYFWGRACPNLASPGFAALASMPSLRGLAVSCKNVDEAVLSTLPLFPALREFMPMDFSDAGFRHIGRCENLTALWCMYCRDTGDEATEHIAGLRKLASYYAGATRITDRSLEILARMESLERLEFWQCLGITDAGVSQLVRLPKLREIGLHGSAAVTLDVTRLFPSSVDVNYS